MSALVRWFVKGLHLLNIWSAGMALQEPVLAAPFPGVWCAIASPRP